MYRGHKLVHFYHAFADGDYTEAIEEHIKALIKYELIDYLDAFYIGLVGTQENQNNVLNIFTSYNIFPRIVVSTPYGYEQETLDKVYEYAQSNEAMILYAHTKGTVFNVTPHSKLWRANMCFFNIVNWQNQIHALENYDIAGCYWYPLTDHPPHYQGTYWWANTSYIRTLPPVSRETRWEAEFWIGKNPNVSQFDAGIMDENMYIPREW